jgi:hypothetical protein
MTSVFTWHNTAPAQPYHARWLLIYEKDASGRWFITDDVDEGGEP